MGEDDKEILAHWMIRHEYATGHGDTIEDLLDELKWQIAERFERAIASEREECAKVCDAIAISARKKYKETYNPYEDGRADGAWECEEAIRARGRSEALTNLNKAAEDMGQEL